MSLDKATVAHVAKLARIRVEESDLEPMAAELNNIMTWIEQLNEVDTDGVQPMTSVVESVLRQRSDDITDGGYADKVTQNAPASEASYFVVPKVVE